MYGIYKQLHPPTGVEISVFCHFFNSTEKNLVVGAVNQLQVFKLNSEVEVRQEKGPDGSVKKREKLECVMSFPLFGSLACIEPVRLPGAHRDGLLIAFQQGKLSLLEYDPSTHDLKTLSLHYFEDEAMKDGHCQNSQHLPLLRVDPEARCAGLLIYGSRLVILPFRRDATAEAETDTANKPTPIMSSYIIDLKKTDERIRPVLDMQFLHGYYEPTLLILYEPLPTWSGRVAVRKDSCSIAAISLNIQEKAHPVIWSQGNLPFDCQQTFAVPKPIGGVMVFATNSLIYLNQSFPPYGVSLNSLADVSTEFLLRPQEGVKIALDNARAAFIADDKLVMSLRGGELYVLTLVVDTMRAVRSFHLDKAAASVLTTCICPCGSGYLFLGSRLGNSLLLKYTEKNSEGELMSAKKENTSDEPAAKKMKKDNISDWMASDISQVEDLDELEVYGDQPTQQLSSTIGQFSFEVCDSIMNIGPCGQTMMGEPAFLSEEFNTEVDPDLELVTTSGYGKNGAISVLQRSIRPQVVTTFELPGCTDMWTVMDGSEETAEGHAFLIMSREDASMVLRTGQEIMELDQSGFHTSGPTVFASNLGKYILQVHTNGVSLLEGVNQVQHIPIDFGCPIVSCSAADPYVTLMSERGQIMLLTLKTDPNGEGMKLVCSRPTTQQGSQPLAMCVYKDQSGMFASHRTEQERSKSPDDTSKQSTDAPATDAGAAEDVDDEDELLYGESDISTLFATVKQEPEAEIKQEPKQVTKTEVQTSYWVLVAKDNGSLEIYSLPDFNLSYMVKNFPDCSRVLVDSVQQKQQGAAQHSRDSDSDIPVVREILMVGLGNNHSRPHLLARIDDSLVMYEAYPYSTTSAHLTQKQSKDVEDRPQLRFKKLPHGLILKQRRARGAKPPPTNPHARWLRPFDDISGYSGVFICGLYPHWLIMGPRGSIRLHGMSIDGAINCFTPFHNVNCPKGFLYFNKEGELRISVLPTHLSYDAPWPVRKVPLRCTPYSACYHLDSKTYSIVTSMPETCKKFVKVIGDGEKEFETHERDERFIYPNLEKFIIQLFSPVSWEPIPNTKVELEEFEHVTCIKSVSLKSEGTLSGLKQFVALSTSYAYNEDVTARGRLIIYDVIEVVPEPGQPLTKNKIKIEYDKEQKGPVTCLDHVSGFLVSAIGQKIYIWQLLSGDLCGVAFIDTNVYVHQLTTIKNMILVGDVCKSISLLRFQEDLKVLSLVSRDIKPMEVFSSAFLVDNTNLGFLVSDRLKNLTVFTYNPEVRESHGGQRLIARADVNIDHQVNTFWRVRCKLTDPSLNYPVTGPLERRHVTYFATLDGSIGYILPLSEKVYRRLLMLQNALNSNLPHIAGLNPKGYRCLRQEYRQLSNAQRNILDGELLWMYTSLSRHEQAEMTRRIGIDRTTVIDDLLEIDRCTAHF